MASNGEAPSDPMPSNGDGTPTTFGAIVSNGEGSVLPAAMASNADTASMSVPGV